MNISHPCRAAVRRDPAGRGTAAPPRVRSRVAASGLLLAGIAVATAATQSAALAAPPSAASRSHAPAGGGLISWSVAPASTTGPDARPKFSYVSIKPGSSISDHVAIFNRSRQTVAFTLYATDATGTTAANSLTLLPAAKQPVDIGSWVTFPRHVARLSVIIPSHKGVIEAFSVAVPQQATPGDHTGGMIAAVAFQIRNARGHLVTVDERVAVPIELRVTGLLHTGLRVESISASFNNTISPFGDGSATVSYSVVNTGNVRLAGRQAVSVTGPFGIASKSRLTKLPVVLPGDSVRITERAPGLYPAGPLTAQVHLSPANPTGAAPIPEPVAASSGSASLFAVPWSLIGLLILLAAAGVGIWQLQSWRRRRLRSALTTVAEKARREAEAQLLGDQGSSEALDSSAAQPQGQT